MKTGRIKFPAVILLSVALNVQAQEFENIHLTSRTLIASSFISDNEGWLAANTGFRSSELRF